MDNQSKPEDDPTSIGNILISMELLTKDELESLVSKFKASKEELFGEFIVRHHSKITKDHIEVAVIKQRAMRNNGHTQHAALSEIVEVSTRINNRIMSTADELTLLTKGFKPSA